MKEELVSFETAKLLKEKGFDDFTKEVTSDYPFYWSCTQSLAQKWLREKHNIYIAIMPAIIPSNEVKYYVYKGKKSWDWNDLHNTYEDALEEGLKQGLMLIK